VQDLKIPLETMKQRVLAAAGASFLPENEKLKLIQNLKKELKIS